MIPPWLEEPVQVLGAALAGGRMPHGLLIHEAPGTGGTWLARYLARLLLCETATPPCGACTGCRRVSAGQHPDLLWVAPLEEARQIRIEQVRELSESLALTSHQGRWKVAVLEPADTLNRFAANALLKTLEEPPARTLLILVASEPSRLPATILSRCQRIRIAAPPRASALAWLQATRGAGEWGRVLDVLGEAPVLAAECEPDAVLALSQEVLRGLEAAAQGTLDPANTAERWARESPGLRLRCIENWITARIRAGATSGGHFTELRPGPYLPQAAPVLNIRALFGVLDQVRELRASLDAPLNKGLALESVLRRLAQILAPKSAAGMVPGRR